MRRTEVPGESFSVPPILEVASKFSFGVNGQSLQAIGIALASLGELNDLSCDQGRKRPSGPTVLAA